MNTQQRKYALERVDQILAAKVSRARDASCQPVKKITDKQRYELIASGKVKLDKEMDSISTYCDVVNVFDFSKHVNSGQPVREVYQPVVDKLTADASAVRDQIMLGDAEEALRLLHEFAA